jgi:DNA-binding HxlR family transcriptional regulator
MLSPDGPLSDDGALADILGRIGDRWTIPTLVLLGHNARALGDIRRALAGITQRGLMQTLKSLERDGLAERLPDALDATLIRYDLTDRGRSLLPLLTGLTRWASDNRVGILDTRAAFDRAQAERAALLPRELTRPR